MASPTPVADLSQYYLQLQALTPVDPASVPPPPKTDVSLGDLTLPTALIPVIFFVVIFFLTLIGVIFSSFKTNDYMGKSVKLALVLAVIPLGISLVHYQTSLQSQAGPDNLPVHLILTPPDQNSLKVTWQTNSPSLGALRVSPDPSFSTGTLNFNQDSKILSTVHSYEITSLKPATTYYLQIFSQGKWYQNVNGPIPFTTLP